MIAASLNIIITLNYNFFKKTQEGKDGEPLLPHQKQNNTKDKTQHILNTHHMILGNNYNNTNNGNQIPSR